MSEVSLLAALWSRFVAVLHWLAGLEWLAAGLAAPLLIFSTVRPRWTVAALAVLVALWLLRWLVRREPWPLTPFNAALLLFAVMVLVSIVVSARPETTAPEAAQVLLGLVAFRAIPLAVRDRRTLALAVVAFCLLGLSILGLGVVSAQWPAKLPVLGALAGRIPRLVSALPQDRDLPGANPSHLAGPLTLYLPFAAALVWANWFGRPARLRRLLTAAAGLAFLVLVAGVLLLTQSRSGWIGAAVGLLALATLWGLSGCRRWMRVLGVALPLLVVVAAVVGVFAVGPARIAAAFDGAGGGEPIDTAVGEVTMTGRVELWNRALYAIQDFPFTGCGLGAFRSIVHTLYPLFEAGPDEDVGHAHNIFLQVALDIGLPGLVAYLALLIIAGTVCWRSARSGDPLLRPLALGLAAGLVGLHAYGLTDAIALGSKPAVTFWVALGLIAALPPLTPHPSRLTDHASRITPHARSHPWLTAVLVLLVLGLLTTSALVAGGWQTEIETGNATSWGGIYPRDRGHSVCLLNLFVSVIANSLWIVGLALLLAALSWAHGVAVVERLRFRQALARPGVRRAWDIGLVLFCAGSAATVRAWWERALWGLLALGWIVRLWWNRRAQPESNSVVIDRTRSQ